jgi:hypothetical protein
MAIIAERILTENKKVTFSNKNIIILVDKYDHHNNRKNKLNQLTKQEQIKKLKEWLEHYEYRVCKLRKEIINSLIIKSMIFSDNNPIKILQNKLAVNKNKIRLIQEKIKILENKLS